MSGETSENIVRVALFRDDSMDDFPYRPCAKLASELDDTSRYCDKPKCIIEMPERQWLELKRIQEEREKFEEDMCRWIDAEELAREIDADLRMYSVTTLEDINRRKDEIKKQIRRERQDGYKREIVNQQLNLAARFREQGMSEEEIEIRTGAKWDREHRAIDADA